MSTNWLHESVDDPNLRQSVQDLIKAYPASSRVIERLVRYYDNKPSDREAKRRKAEEATLSNDEVFRLMDVSFQLPARKKYNLILTGTRLLLHNGKTDTMEFQCNLDDISPLGGACVPSPDKATKCNTFTLFLKGEDCLVFNSQDKGDMILRKPNAKDEILKEDKHQVICDLLTKHARIPITQPSKEFFRSTGVSATTGKVIEDKAHCVAYLKAKDGFLFFLPTGILFGFKKPTLFIPVSSLASNVITNITQRTFDLTLSLKSGSQILGSAGFRTTKEGDNDTVQFSMIEQSEYGGIEGYTKKLGVNDHSMAEERKAPVPTSKKDQDDSNAKGEEGDDDDSEENDEDFEPSDHEHEPLEYDTDADEEEADRELADKERHEYEDAMSEDEEDQEEGDEEKDLLDEDDD
jgi:hypothetical protein